jgi:hypothetical protein
MALLESMAGAMRSAPPPREPLQRGEQAQGTGPAQAGGAQVGPPSKSASPVTRYPQYRPGPGTRAQQQPAGKTASLDQVQRYAKQKGISDADAIREFSNFGYRIAGQQASQKTATMDQVRAYAEKNGITLSEAIRQAKAEGFQINSAPRGQQGQGSGSQTRYRYYANDNGRLRGSNNGKSWTDIGRGKLTDPDTARRYLDQAGGDKDRARQLARADGWEEF